MSAILAVFSADASLCSPLSKWGHAVQTAFTEIESEEKMKREYKQAVFSDFRIFLHQNKTGKFQEKVMSTGHN